MARRGSPQGSNFGCNAGVTAISVEVASIYHGSGFVSKIAIASLQNKHGGRALADDSCVIKDASESRIVRDLSVYQSIK